MQNTLRYLCYILTICSVSFYVSFSSLIKPRIQLESPVEQTTFKLPPAIKRNIPNIRADIAPVVSLFPLTDKGLYPLILGNVVRISNLAGSTAGSGVVIWTGLDFKKMAHTFILTNRHVLPVGMPGAVEVFSYLNFRDVESVTTYPCFTVVQSSEADLALIEVVSNNEFLTTATLISPEEYTQMPMYTDLFIVGCGLANPPCVSPGKVFQFGEDTILLNGFSVWGFSGGGVFDRCGHLVSISCQIAMATVGKDTYAITNISLSIPVNVINSWLLTTNYKFIVSPELGSLDDVTKPKKFH